jgi:hypothetical protein
MLQYFYVIQIVVQQTDNIFLYLLLKKHVTLKNLNNQNIFATVNVKHNISINIYDKFLS